MNEIESQESDTGIDINKFEKIENEEEDEYLKAALRASKLEEKFDVPPRPTKENYLTKTDVNQQKPFKRSNTKDEKVFKRCLKTGTEDQISDELPTDIEKTKEAIQNIYHDMKTHFQENINEYWEREGEQQNEITEYNMQLKNILNEELQILPDPQIYLHKIEEGLIQHQFAWYKTHSFLEVTVVVNKEGRKIYYIENKKLKIEGKEVEAAFEFETQPAVTNQFSKLDEEYISTTNIGSTDAKENVDARVQRILPVDSTTDKDSDIQRILDEID